MLQQSFAILNEINSWPDVDAMKIFSTEKNSMKDEKYSVIVITHQNKLLEYINPELVHINS